MTTRTLAVLASLAAVAGVAACSTNPARYGHDEPDAADPVARTTRHGTVSRIDVLPIASRATVDSAVLGAVIGAVAGNASGGGISPVAASGPGTVGGALFVDRVVHRSKADSEVFRVSVRLDDGRMGQFDYQRIDDLRVGDRVRVQGGELHRV